MKSLMNRFRSDEIPKNAEHFLKSDFITPVDRGPSLIAPNIGQILPDKFHCPRCSVEMEEPEHGQLTTCLSCNLRMVAYGNSLRAWV
jgi:hypothetical protein